MGGEGPLQRIVRSPVGGAAALLEIATRTELRQLPLPLPDLVLEPLPFLIVLRLLASQLRLRPGHLRFLVLHGVFQALCKNKAASSFQLLTLVGGW